MKAAERSGMEVRTVPDSVAAPPQHRELAPDHPLRSMALSSTGLKIMNETDQITTAFDQYDTMIVSVATSGGKTIGLPLILLQYKPDSRIAITQPRNAPMKRISSRTAKLAKDAVGGLIGVRYRGSGEKWSDKTQIMYEMEQTLLNELEEDPRLRKYNIAMVDEQHEAGGRTQFLLQRLLDAQKLRKDEGLEPLKIVIASATIDTQKLKDQLVDQLKFQRENEQYDEEALKKTIGVVDIEGVTPEEIKKVYADRDFAPEEMPEEVARMAKSIIDTEENQGDILIFLAGMPEIRKAGEELAARGVTGETFDIHILSSATTEEEKEAIASKAPGGKRKIILSTNSGETGMTFHKDLYYMIDTLIKQTMVDKDTGMEYLATVEHSWSGCMQRDGRLGRVGPGEARHLYTKKNFELREQVNKYPMPEIQRSNLIPYMLELLRIGKTDVRNFRFLDQPDPHIIDMAMKSLKTLGAIDEHEHLTPIGQEMATMGIEPHLARMVVEGKQRGSTHTMATIAALIDNAQALLPRKNQADSLVHRGSDILTLLRVYQEYQTQPNQEARKSFAQLLNISPQVFETIRSKSKEIAGEAPADTVFDEDTIGRCIAAGYKDQIIEKKASGSYAFLANPHASPLYIDPYSFASDTTQKYLTIGSIRKNRTGQTLAQLCHKLKEKWIEDILLPEAAQAKPEPTKTELAPARAVSKPPKIRPIPVQPATIPNGRQPPEMPRPQSPPPPKTLWYRAKQIARFIFAPVRLVWRVLKHLFTGHA